MICRILFMVVLLPLFGAAQTADTTKRNSFKVDMHQKHWSVSIHTGLQKRYFIGAGISKNLFLGSRHGVYGYDFYGSFQYFPAFKKTQTGIYGLRAGAMACGNFFVLGGEVQYLKTGKMHDVLWTPKIGLGASLLHLTYGYSFSSNHYPIQAISRNSITVQMNLPIYTKDLKKVDRTNEFRKS